MFRATTPTFTLTFDVDPEAAFKTILITFKQDSKIVLEKKKSDLSFGAENTASFMLSQEETNLFDTRKYVSIQVRAITTDDEAVAFKVIKTTVFDVLNDVVLS